MQAAVLTAGSLTSFGGAVFGAARASQQLASAGTQATSQARILAGPATRVRQHLWTRHC